jgi:hypothetical protein
LIQRTQPKSKRDVEKELSPERLKKRLDSLEARLDSIDSMVTNVAERIMKQPLSLTITCPNCGRILEIGVVGNEKMMR